MNSENTSRYVERLIEKLDELETQLALDPDAVIERFEKHRRHFRDALQALPVCLAELENQATGQTPDLERELNQLEVQLDLGKMETEDAYWIQRDGLARTLRSLESTVRRIEATDENEPWVAYRFMARRARLLEDELEALHAHFFLRKTYNGDALANARYRLRKTVTEIAMNLRSTEAPAPDDLESIGKNIREVSQLVGDCFRELLHYLDTFDVRCKRLESAQ